MCIGDPVRFCGSTRFGRDVAHTPGNFCQNRGLYAEASRLARKHRARLRLSRHRHDDQVASVSEGQRDEAAEIGSSSVLKMGCRFKMISAIASGQYRLPEHSVRFPLGRLRLAIWLRWTAAGSCSRSRACFRAPRKIALAANRGPPCSER
jgi:hypothetical protein